MVMMEPKWTNTAHFCMAFPISSLGFTQTLQTPPGHPLCSVWPCLLSDLGPQAILDMWPSLTSLFWRPVFGPRGREVVPVKVFSQEFTQALPPPHGWTCDLQGECLRQRDGWNDLSSFPRNSRGRVSSPRQGLWPPHSPRGLCFAPPGVRSAWEGDDNDGSLASSHRPEWESLEERLWRKSAWAQNQHPPPPALPAMTWAETDPLLKLMNWQLNTQLLDVPVPTEYPAWHVRAWRTEESTAVEDLVSPPAPRDHASVGTAMYVRIRLD